MVRIQGGQGRHILLSVSFGDTVSSVGLVRLEKHVHAPRQGGLGHVAHV
jgi:hypothetical protein